MKKLLSLAISIILMVFSISACGDNINDSVNIYENSQLIDTSSLMTENFEKLPKNNSLEKEYSWEFDSDMYRAPDHEELEDIVDNNKHYSELITKEIDIHDFAQYYESFEMYTMDINDVYEKFGIECLRHTSDNALYSVHKVKQGGLLYIVYHTDEFDLTGEIFHAQVNNWFYVREKLSNEMFKNLKIGKATLDDVIRIDATTQIYKNIYSESTENWTKYNHSQSWHYMNDGILSIIYIHKDGKNLVEKIELISDFNLKDLTSSKVRFSSAKILDIDSIK